MTVKEFKEVLSVSPLVFVWVDGQKGSTPYSIQTEDYDKEIEFIEFSTNYLGVPWINIQTKKEE